METPKVYRLEELSEASQAKAIKEFKRDNIAMERDSNLPKHKKSLSSVKRDILTNGNYRFYKNGDFATIVEAKEMDTKGESMKATLSRDERIAKKEWDREINVEATIPKTFIMPKTQSSSRY